MTDQLTQLRAENATLRTDLSSAQDDLRDARRENERLKTLILRIIEKASDLGPLLQIVNEAHGEIRPQ